MNEYTVIWKPGDIDDYEYSYVMADEPDDIDSQTIIAGVQNNEYYNDRKIFPEVDIICVIEGHVGVNFP